MKRTISSFLVILASATLFAEHVSQEEAVLVAENFMNVAPASGSR